MHVNSDGGGYTCSLVHCMSPWSQGINTPFLLTYVIKLKVFQSVNQKYPISCAIASILELAWKDLYIYYSATRWIVKPVEQYWVDVNNIAWTCISGVRPALASASVSQMQQSQLMNKLRLKFCKCACLQLNSNCKLSCDYCKLSSGEFADILLWIFFFFLSFYGLLKVVKNVLEVTEFVFTTCKTECTKLWLQDPSQWVLL
jgi:hypothetical protein